VDAGNYRDIPVDVESSFSSEELVDLKRYGIAGTSHYHISDGTNPPYRQKLDGSIPQLLARRSVAEKLARVNQQLADERLELFVWDAYRPLATQIGIWRFFDRQVRANDPSLDDNAVYNEVIKYVSDPNRFNSQDSRTWPTHMTGASVDLTIRRMHDLERLDMGADFDQMDETAHTSHFEILLTKGEIRADDARLQNRRLLYFVMAEQGFTNYPLEYWHFDWGNQMHQFIRSINTSGPTTPAHYAIVYGEDGLLPCSP